MPCTTNVSYFAVVHLDFLGLSFKVTTIFSPIVANELKFDKPMFEVLKICIAKRPERAATHFLMAIATTLQAQKNKSQLDHTETRETKNCAKRKASTVVYRIK
jgi:hypothetical protein